MNCGGGGGGGGGGGNMPRPKLGEGKVLPETRYTSGTQVTGDGRDAVRSSFHLHIDAGEDDDEEEEEAVVAASMAGLAKNYSSGIADNDYDTEDSEEEEEEEEHLPAGQHLLVDIKHVDGTFLNSEERLARAMVETVNDASLTLLSYHCHSLVPSGVSCVGVLLESHISFHTWPAEGVITLDLFTCGSHPLLPAVETIERLFAIPMADAGTYQPLGRGAAGAGASSANASSSSSYVPREEDYVSPPHLVWSHVLRGFRPPLEDGRDRILESDVAFVVLERLDLDHKVQVASVQTPFQHIFVFDVIEPRFNSMRGYERSVRPELKDSTYEGRHPELYRPDRKVFLDGVIQSTRLGDEPYHEALVHPGMFAHPHPERAAIIGGGEGATLREILKHNTIETVKMIEIDEVMVNVSREFLPDWSDCSDLKRGGGEEEEEDDNDNSDKNEEADSCFEDSRTDLMCRDALAWFMDRFEYPACDCGEGSALKQRERAYCGCDGEDTPKSLQHDDDDDDEDSSDDDDEDDEEDSSDEENQDERDRLRGTEEPFDVIVMDALDPQENVDFADVLYRNAAFLESLYGGLTDDGVLVMQLGMSPYGKNAAEEVTYNENRAAVMDLTSRLGFESMHVYEESRCGFEESWSFLVACKSYDCRNQWYSSEAEIAAEMHRRILPTKSGDPALKYFDGATMKSYQNPTKAWETVYCRRPTDPMPEGCDLYRGLDPRARNFDSRAFEVRESSVQGAGRGTFVKEDVPKGSMIMQDEAVKKVHLGHRSTTLMTGYYEKMEEAEDLFDLYSYFEGYGVEDDNVAYAEYYVDSGSAAFVNHGCNGTSNMGGLTAKVKGDPAHARYTNNVRHVDETGLDPASDDLASLVFGKDGDGGSGGSSMVGAFNPFNPVRDRHLPAIGGGYDVATRDIAKGEELFSNYMLYEASVEGLSDAVRELGAQCRGEEVGRVKAEEVEWENEKRADAATVTAAAAAAAKVVS